MATLGFIHSREAGREVSEQVPLVGAVAFLVLSTGYCPLWEEKVARGEGGGGIMGGGSVRHSRLVLSRKIPHPRKPPPPEQTRIVDHLRPPSGAGLLSPRSTAGTLCPCPWDSRSRWCLLTGFWEGVC